MAADPFTQVHRYIMDTLKAYTPLSDVIAANNFIDITERGKRPFSDTNRLGPADFPFLLLEPSSEDVKLKGTSTSGEITQEFTLVLATSEIEPADTSDSQDLFYPLKFETLRALFPIIGGQSFAALDYYDFTLRHLDVTTITDSRTDSLFDTGIQAWVCEITIIAILTLPRATILVGD